MRSSSRRRSFALNARYFAWFSWLSASHGAPNSYRTSLRENSRVRVVTVQSTWVTRRSCSPRRTVTPGHGWVMAVCVASPVTKSAGAPSTQRY